ncbi:MAG: 5-amino-6-(D-ribitylamino)uracil--L-tyrosine 4-hydroxyphenyl transferase CofH, partial [Pseudohongiellaceae bacterium]
LWSLAVARLVFGADMSIQAPPNLSPGVLEKLVAAGINDWGGVSPLTPDHVNPEAPWPHLDRLAQETALAGKFLEQRLTVYPRYALDHTRWLDPGVTPDLLRHMDSDGFAKRDTWHSGVNRPVPALEQSLLQNRNAQPGADIQRIVAACLEQKPVSEADVTVLFQARGADFGFVCQQADALRQTLVGDAVSYAVNRNINYTNVCYFKCQFCAFSKGQSNADLRGRPYDISAEEIARRCQEAWQRGATEVCMQGGIHPDYTGQTYVDIVRTVKAATPDMHVHAFSPLEVWQGAATAGVDIRTFLRQLQAAGLDTLPGTAAEILHDDVRQQICADKLNSEQWLEVMRTAHEVGFNTTATIMFGHLDHARHWATHLLRLKTLQDSTGGFTEFVPLPYVHMEAPLYRRGGSRRGPSFREAVLMHAVSRL